MTPVPFRQLADRVELLLLGHADLPWIAALVDEVEAACGQPWRVLLERLAERPARSVAGRHAAVVQAIRASLSGRTGGELAPARLRRQLLGAPALDPAARDRRLWEIAMPHGKTAAEIEALLWADLPGERLVAMPHGRPAPLDIAARANLALIQRALARSHAVTLRLRGNARDVVRTATLRGLMVTARRVGGDVELALSGPLALFHRTSVYGRALGSLVPHLAWCEQFTLEAHCELGAGPGTLILRPPLLLPPGPQPRRFDSALEARFARELAACAPAWRITREPAALEAGRGLVFPDFLAEHRADAGRRWWIELVGFWTSAYLGDKLARYRAAALPDVILCIDEQRALCPDDLPAEARVIRYRRRVDPAAVLAVMEG